MQKIAFLVGSGLSSSAGMPSTHDITDQVLCPGNAQGHADNAFHWQDSGTAANGRQIGIALILSFLRCLKQEVDRYYANQPEHYTDYEDLYYAATQIYDSEQGEYDNPAILPFVEKILAEIQALPGSHVEPPLPLHELAAAATRYIRDVVWHLLIGRPEREDPMASIKGACEDPQLKRIDIFSLNHDTVLERYMESQGIAFTDGFGAPVEGIRYWNPDLFKAPDCRVRLFKLHGSVNWFRLHDDRCGETIGIPADWKYRPQLNAAHAAAHPAGGAPLFLAGTFNKMLQYINDIYADLHYQFRYTLREAQHFFVCGYSFGDKGINTRIIEWIHQDRGKTLIVAHPDPEGLKQKARPGIARHLDDWEAQGRLHFLPKAIEDVSWEEVRRACEPKLTRPTPLVSAASKAP